MLGFAWRLRNEAARVLSERMHGRCVHMSRYVHRVTVAALDLVPLNVSSFTDRCMVAFALLTAHNAEPRDEGNHELD